MGGTAAELHKSILEQIADLMGWNGWYSNRTGCIVLEVGDRPGDFPRYSLQFSIRDEMVLECYSTLDNRNWCWGYWVWARLDLAEPGSLARRKLRDFVRAARERAAAGETLYGPVSRRRTRRGATK